MNTVIYIISSLNYYFKEGFKVIQLVCTGILNNISPQINIIVSKNAEITEAIEARFHRQTNKKQ